MFPQSAANNAMLRSAATEYLVPVDSDMILYPGWTSKVVSAIREHECEEWYQILFPLWDTLLQRRIGSLKILKTDVMKRNLYDNVRVPDLPHFYEMRQQGHHVINLVNEEVLPIGSHVIRGHKTCYLKLKDNVLCRRRYEWHYKASFDEYVRTEYEHLYDLFRKTGNPEYLSCIAGMADGLTADVTTSKDFNEPIRLTVSEGVRAVRRHLGLNSLL